MLPEHKIEDSFILARQLLANWRQVQVTAFYVAVIALVVMKGYCGLHVDSADNRLRIDGS